MRSDVTCFICFPQIHLHEQPLLNVAWVHNHSNMSFATLRREHCRYYMTFTFMFEWTWRCDYYNGAFVKLCTVQYMDLIDCDTVLTCTQVELLVNSYWCWGLPATAGYNIITATAWLHMPCIHSIYARSPQPLTLTIGFYSREGV